MAVPVNNIILDFHDNLVILTNSIPPLDHIDHLKSCWDHIDVVLPFMPYAYQFYIYKKVFILLPWSCSLVKGFPFKILN